MAALFGAPTPGRGLLLPLAREPPGGDTGLAALLDATGWLPAAVPAVGCAAGVLLLGKTTIHVLGVGR